jgi:hypothetical protein
MVVEAVAVSLQQTLLVARVRLELFGQQLLEVLLVLVVVAVALVVHLAELLAVALYTVVGRVALHLQQLPQHLVVTGLLYLLTIQQLQ